jgi:hypothetical protein
MAGTLTRLLAHSNAAPSGLSLRGRVTHPRLTPGATLRCRRFAATGRHNRFAANGTNRFKPPASGWPGEIRISRMSLK